MARVLVCVPPGSFVGYPFNEPAIVMGTLGQFKPRLIEMHLMLLEYFIKTRGKELVPVLRGAYQDDYNDVILCHYLGRVFYTNNAAFLLDLAREPAFLEDMLDEVETHEPTILLFDFQFLRTNPASIEWVSWFCTRLKARAKASITCAILGSNLKTLDKTDVGYIDEKLPGIDALIQSLSSTTLLEFVRAKLENDSKIPPDVHQFRVVPSKTAFNFDHKDEILTWHKDAIEYPVPDWSQVDFDGYLDSKAGTRACMVASTRGCTARCTFCDERLKLGPYTERDIDLVSAEIAYLQREKGVRIIRFSDCLLNARLERLAELSSMMARHEVFWMGMMRADKFLTRTFMDMLHSSGCRFLWFGLESASIATQKRLDKHANPALAAEVFRNAKAAGIKIAVLLMANLPFETVEDARATSEYIRQHHELIDCIHVEPFRLMKGTVMHVDHAAYGIERVTPKPLSFDVDFTASASIDTDVSIRETFFAMKGTKGIVLPSIEGMTFVTEI